MNDPGIDEPIQDAAQDFEEPNPYEHQQKLEEEEEQNFLDPSRWWFASTACPLIAGTFGPMASAFNICALTQPWREYIPPGQNEATGGSVSDSAGVLSINAISLVLALAANIALLLNMARRASFAIAQPITIIGWFISSFLLIGLVAFADTDNYRISPHQNHALTQAYYYAIISATLYFIISVLMILTVVGAVRGHYEKEFRLTVSQRTLMLQTIGFMAYLLLGSLVYGYIEGWKYLDALYWADFTLLTVGIGTPLVPATHLGRSLMFPFAIGGIVTVGLVIGSIRSLVLERGKQKMEARFTEKKRESVLSTVDTENRTIRVGWFKRYKFSQHGLTESQRREQEFEIMRRIQNDAQTRRRWVALAMSASAAMALWLLGALVFMISEQPQGWSYFVALYFSYTTLLTIGYGDYQPQSNSGKAFFVFWTLLAVPALTILISNMGDTVVKSFSELTIWAGSVTILPGEEGIKASVKSAMKKLSAGRLLKESDFRTDKPPGILPSKGAGGDVDKPSMENIKSHALDRLASHVEDAELDQALQAGEEGDPVERDIHLYHFVLVRELRQLMRDMQASPPRQYSFREWAWYLKLLGQDESNPELHREPPVVPRQRKTKKTTGKLEERSESLGKADADNDLQWSWLGTRSPLMGSKTEAEWLVERLSAQLEKELARAKSRDPKVRGAKPPIGFADLQQHQKENDSKDPEKTAAEKGKSSDGSEAAKKDT